MKKLYFILFFLIFGCKSYHNGFKFEQLTYDVEIESLEFGVNYIDSDKFSEKGVSLDYRIENNKIITSFYIDLGEDYLYQGAYEFKGNKILLHIKSISKNLSEVCKCYIPYKVSCIIPIKNKSLNNKYLIHLGKMTSS